MDKLIYRHGEKYLMRSADAVMLNNHEDYDYARSVEGVGEKAHFVSASEGCGIDIDILHRFYIARLGNIATVGG